MTGLAVSFSDVLRARGVISGSVARTPLLAAAWAPGNLWLKAESLQPTGAFKLRGATHAIARLDAAARAGGVVTHSSGNHGQAVAWAARAAGISATIVMPEGAAPVKVAACRSLDAEVLMAPVSQRTARAREVSEERGMTMIHPFDDPDVISGQGTVALEIAEDLSGIDTVLVPVGGGGLISGVAIAIRELSPGTRVIGVESELAADAQQSLASGHRVSWTEEDTQRTIADGTRAPSLGVNTFPIVQRTVDTIVTVTEDEILAAMAHLARRARLVVEPSGALSVAAYLNAPNSFGRTVAILSGGNVDMTVLTRALALPG
jgi:threonine dehydratase